MAEISDIGRLMGSLFAALIFICLISQPSLAAKTPATTVSKAMPHINIFQPRFDFNFSDLTSSTKVSGCSFFSASSAFFSIQSPRNTSTPPEIATRKMRNSPTNQDNEDDESTVEIIFILSPAARAIRGRFARAGRRRRSGPTCRRRKIRGSSAPCLPSLCGWNPRSATRSRLRRGG